MPTMRWEEVCRVSGAVIDNAQTNFLVQTDRKSITLHTLESLTKLDAFVKGDQETRHAGIGDRQSTVPSLISLRKNGSTEPREPTTLP